MSNLFIVCSTFSWISVLFCFKFHFILAFAYTNWYKMLQFKFKHLCIVVVLHVATTW